jgi:hypothetical protein
MAAWERGVQRDVDLCHLVSFVSIVRFELIQIWMCLSMYASRAALVRMSLRFCG